MEEYILNYDRGAIHFAVRLFDDLYLSYCLGNAHHLDTAACTWYTVGRV